MSKVETVVVTMKVCKYLVLATLKVFTEFKDLA